MQPMLSILIAIVTVLLALMLAGRREAAPSERQRGLVTVLSGVGLAVFAAVMAVATGETLAVAPLAAGVVLIAAGAWRLRTAG